MSLFSSLGSSGDALGVFQRAFDVVQNNINNSTTPGFASQSLNLIAKPFDLTSGWPAAWRPAVSSALAMNTLKREVRRQVQLLGRYRCRRRHLRLVELF